MYIINAPLHLPVEKYSHIKHGAGIGPAVHTYVQTTSYISTICTSRGTRRTQLSPGEVRLITHSQPSS